MLEPFRHGGEYWEEETSYHIMIKSQGCFFFSRGPESLGYDLHKSFLAFSLPLCETGMLKQVLGASLSLDQRMFWKIPLRAGFC